MSKDKELKAIPCPLCNGKAFWNLPTPTYDGCDNKPSGWTFRVSCHVCGLRLTSDCKNLEELDRIKTKLITAWGTRAEGNQIKELEEEKESLRVELESTAYEIDDYQDKIAALIKKLTATEAKLKKDS